LASSGLSYYGARYLAPWLARWISPDAAGSVAGSNLYVYAGNNPLKYIDPTIAFLLHLDFVFTCNDGSTTIRIIMFVTKGLGFVVQL
jgi:uncharacterized protein RhaS with RHS repeats